MWNSALDDKRSISGFIVPERKLCRVLLQLGNGD